MSLNHHTKAVDIILPVPFGHYFSYEIAEDKSVHAGCRVVVPFGNRKHLTGIVVGENSEPNTSFALKPITEILDKAPIVTDRELEFWNWIASYYMCSIGEVMKAAVPSSLMVESNSILKLNPTYDGQVRFEGNEARVFEWLTANEKGELKHIEKALGIKNTYQVIKNLLAASSILLEEKIAHKYSPKTEVFVTVSDLFKEEAVLDAFFKSLKRAPKQEELLLSYFEQKELEGDEFIRRGALTKNNQYTAYRALLKKGVFKEHSIEVSRLEEHIPVSEPHSLTSWQQEALMKVEESFTTKTVTLLKGASASGKTEIYIHLIRKYIQAGKQVLFIVPEISLTTQLSKRLKKVFGAEMALFHSKYNHHKRSEVWTSISQSNKIKVVVGARSALFLPFNNLGLIVIDEEHERSFKQHEPQPKYHARDAAIVMAGFHQAKVLLGSATPSVETLYNVARKKYGFVEMTHRYGNTEAPEISIVDLNASYKKRKLKDHFSYELLEQMSDVLDRGKQIILFQNRRGYAPIMTCQNCGWTQKCRQCDVTLTWHYDKNLMGCHYCGLTQRVINMCPECGHEALMDKGFGTEKVEKEIKEIYPDASVQRLDMDSAQSLRKLERIIGDFEEGNIDILIGTQMVSRGLDFDNVELVGVLNADNLFNFPEFRASERALQMLTQVAGRAGRRKTRGRVLIQTHQPAHPVIQALSQGAYNAFVDLELEERKLFKYPPFNRIVGITLKHSNADVLNRCAHSYAKQLRLQLANRVLGPEIPGISRIKGIYQQQILIKSQRSTELNWLKTILLNVQSHMIKHKLIPSSLHISFDVDPH